MADRWLHDLVGKEVVFTGRNEGYEEEELRDLAYRLGSRRVSDDCNLTTNVLVRGWSARWKFGNYGKKEAKVADMQQAGRDVVIIDLAGLLGLQNGTPAPTLTPNVPDAPARHSADSGGDFGAPYRPAGDQQEVRGDGHVFRDPSEVDRGRRGHFGTQDALAALVSAAGFDPRMRPDPDCNYDLAWQESDGTVTVVEVKSLTVENELFQLRHGLGQVLDYAHRLQVRGFRTRCVLALERCPVAVDHWQSLCGKNNVVLTWAPEFHGVVTAQPRPN